MPDAPTDQWLVGAGAPAGPSEAEASAGAGPQRAQRAALIQSKDNSATQRA
jgi:hypothetical protein